MKNYDVAIVGAGPGGIYAAYELMKKDPALSVVVLEAGHSLEKGIVRLMERRLRPVFPVRVARL